jgi:nitrate/TMAO reductase-like tetraheme cytochrome c subunit
VKILLAMTGALLLLAAGAAFSQQQYSGDVLGMHNLSVGSGSSIYLPSGNASCTFCHAPHSGLGGVTPLWAQTLSQASYSPYNSTTYHETGNTKPPLGVTSSLCLSCHDGTVAVGQSVPYGRIPMTGNFSQGDSFGTDLTSSHPFSLVLPMKDAPDLVGSLVSQGRTADPLQKVKLINGNIECTSCHNPHVQATDQIAQSFLVRDSSSGQMCLACHDPNRVVQGQTNLLSGWDSSIHKTATNRVAAEANVGSYSTVGQNACTSCHMNHNANGPARLLRPATPAAPGTDVATQNCMTCHNGGTYLSPAAPNIMSEFSKTGHPLPSGNNAHDENEPGVLSNNRHSTCVDCHSPHASAQVVTFGQPPTIRPSQAGVEGISALDGITPVVPAVNQYENCLRCHGTGPGKKRLIIYGYAPMREVANPDFLNVISEFTATASSSHPVFHDRSSPLPQPSLLNNMLTITGQTSGRPTGPRLFCSDCHNSDDNREFGGSGPNGPHGSRYSHILERNYQFSQASTPGGLVTNTFPNPDLSVNGPYALCGKCHDLNNVLANASWTQHSSHAGQQGFSCSVCHTAHGMGANSAYVSGERLVNFDVNVVGSNGGMPISYSRATNTCVLTCHQVAHNSDGSVTGFTMGSPRGAKRK